MLPGACMGPFKCYLMQMGVECFKLSGKKHYEGVSFNVISVTIGECGQIPRKKRYVKLE